MTGIHTSTLRGYASGMSDLVSSPTLTKRHRFSIGLPRPLWIGLATVVLVVVGVGLRFGLPIYRQHVAIRAIEGMTGIIFTKPRGPNWLRVSVAKDRMMVLDDVIGVHFPIGQATDATLSHLGCLTKVEVLDLRKTDITDSGLAHLIRLNNLKTLNLSETSVTDAGLVSLRGLITLESLQLAGTQVTDSGLSDLKVLTRLTDLSLKDTRVGDVGLSHLDALSSLRRLDLDGTDVTDTGLAHLKALTGLRELKLRNTRVTDAGVAHLRSLTGLRSLYILNNNVTVEECWKLVVASPRLELY